MKACGVILKEFLHVQRKSSLFDTKSLVNFPFCFALVDDRFGHKLVKGISPSTKDASSRDREHQEPSPFL